MELRNHCAVPFLKLPTVEKHTTSNAPALREVVIPDPPSNLEATSVVGKTVLKMEQALGGNSLMVPGAPPRNVHAVATDSSTLHVSWEAPMKSLHHGSIRGYYIGYKTSGTSDPFVYKTVEVKEGQDRSCDITQLRQNTKYNVVVQAFNDKGAGPLSDEVTVRTLEFDPPKPPFLKVAETTTSAIFLEWETVNGKETPVSGYVLHWREQGLEWAEVQIPSEKTSHKFTGLNCGTSYKFYVTAYNSMGKGQPSDVITAKTEGTAPVAASEQSFITRNATTFILRLSAWKSGGCPILFFVIQYKQQRQLDWNVLSPRIEPEEEYAKITNLTPSTWYSILVTAHNNAGPTEVEYVTSTLTLQGGTIEPEIVGEKEQLRKYKSLSIIVPVSCAVIVLIAVSLAVFFLVCKKRGTRLTNHYEGVRGNEEGKSDALAMADLEKTYDQNRESVYFPSPYATSRVPGLHRDEVGLERDGCRSLHHHSGRQSDHLYDIPQQMRDDMTVLQEFGKCHCEHLKGMRGSKRPITPSLLNKIMKKFEAADFLTSHQRSGLPSTAAAVATTVEQTVQSMSAVAAHEECGAGEVLRPYRSV
ncbi:down syndrome cell adhesion molecule-like protein Dscam2 [Trichonephila inaurata madagascariensis]|uniref:Down syndrome cell adhesion molecule-like protein Dscam2 n=1 Tax=Trichonephila inaurata madagascariensis TaxID=2747483 RepID=A0A8X6Y7E8_9ARAC|nr:down syndrome cell adhesion molecule-like protein Dscam2 [Trichonephila inaurata madagascariensis]